MSTVPPLQAAPATKPPSSLGVPRNTRQEIRTRCPPPRFSCSEVDDEKATAETTTRRPYCSTAEYLTSDFPLRIKRDLSASTFRRSLDSESSGSYVSPRSHQSTSNHGEELEMDVFSRQSSDASEEMQKKNQIRSERLLSFQETRKRESTDTETWKTCASAGDAAKSDTLTPTSPIKLEGYSALSKETSSWGDSVESDYSFSQSVIDITKGESYECTLKKIESFDKLSQSSIDEKNLEDNAKSYRRGLFQWEKRYCDDFNRDNVVRSIDDNAIAFKIDYYSEQNERDPDLPRELCEAVNIPHGLFPCKKKVTSNDDEGNGSSPVDGDEGFDSPVYGSRDADELGDIFASRQELVRRDTFRKERSLDSDETSGFISKHSSETTDLSSRLSTNFTTKHLSEPLSSPSDLPRQQHLSEPNDMLQPLSSPSNALLPQHNPDFGSRRLLSVDVEPECRAPGAISKRRENFRKSKRLKHFNLRRIDDTDNDSSCESERPAASTEEPEEPASTRLKEEVGLPKHLSRDGSVDRYGLYKSRSEKTITSFESERGTTARLHDFESFCEAVNFAHRLPVARQKAASADELDLSDEAEEVPVARAPVRHMRRKSRSKRDLTRRLKCLLL